jgi:hypothetical protein
VLDELTLDQLVEHVTKQPPSSTRCITSSVRRNGSV